MDIVLNQEIFSNISKDNITDLPKLEALDEPFQSLVMFLYSMTAIFAFFANILALMMLLVGKRTSVALRKYLANLAIVDLFLAVFSIPFSYTDFMYGQWLFPLYLCPVMNFVTTSAVFVNIYTLIAIGLGRYFAIVYPLESVSWLETRSTTIILTIWVNGIALGSPLLYQTQAVSVIYGDVTYYDCRELWEEQLSSKIYSALLFVVMFIFPFLSLSFLYGSIGITMIKRISPGNADSLRDEAQSQLRLKVMKMLITLVIAFAICWFPLQFFNLVMWMCDDLRIPQTRIHYYTYVITYFICHWLSTAHSFVNPFIYCIMSSNYSGIDIKQLIINSLKRKKIASIRAHTMETSVGRSLIRSATQLNAMLITRDIPVYNHL